MTGALALLKSPDATTSEKLSLSFFVLTDLKLGRAVLLCKQVIKDASTFESIYDTTDYGSRNQACVCALSFPIIDIYQCIWTALQYKYDLKNVYAHKRFFSESKAPFAVDTNTGYIPKSLSQNEYLLRPSSAPFPDRFCNFEFLQVTSATHIQ